FFPFNDSTMAPSEGLLLLLRTPQRSPDPLGREGRLTNPDAGRIEDCIRKSRGYTIFRNLRDGLRAEGARRFVRFDEDHFHLRHLVGLENLVVAKARRQESPLL